MSRNSSSCRRFGTLISVLSFETALQAEDLFLGSGERLYQKRPFSVHPLYSRSFENVVAEKLHPLVLALSFLDRQCSPHTLVLVIIHRAVDLVATRPKIYSHLGALPRLYVPSTLVDPVPLDS